jgi:hypothetical protein
MKLHRRHDQVSRASIEINEAVNRIAAAHDLTYAELMSLLVQNIAMWTKFQIRDERKQDGE